jgi:hypothetical protein
VWESTARKDRDDMQARFTQANNDTLLEEELAALPADAPARTIVNIARATGAKPNLQGEDVLSAGAVDQRKRDDITFRTNEQIRAANATRQPPTMSQTAEAGIINRLSTQWGQLSKTAREITGQVGMMRRGLEAARRGDMPQATEAVLQTFLKVLDPNSVVREGEFWRLNQSMPIDARVAAFFQRLNQGGFMPVEQLEAFAGLAEQMAGDRIKALEPTKQRITATAQRYQIPPELVMDDVALPAAAEDQPAEVGGAPGAAPTLSPYQAYLRKKGGK